MCNCCWWWCSLLFLLYLGFSVEPAGASPAAAAAPAPAAVARARTQKQHSSSSGGSSGGAALPSSASTSSSAAWHGPPRKLHGKFLHITGKKELHQPVQTGVLQNCAFCLQIESSAVERSWGRKPRKKGKKKEIKKWMYDGRKGVAYEYSTRPLRRGEAKRGGNRSAP